MTQYLILLLLTISNIVYGQYCQPLEEEVLQRAKIITLERRIDSIGVYISERDSIQFINDEKDKQLHFMYEVVLGKCEETNIFITNEVLLLNKENEDLTKNNNRLKKANKKTITIGAVLIIIALII